MRASYLNTLYRSLFTRLTPYASTPVFGLREICHRSSYRVPRFQQASFTAVIHLTRPSRGRAAAATQRAANALSGGGGGGKQATMYAFHRDFRPAENLFRTQTSFVNLRLILPYSVSANVMRSTALVRCLRPAVLRPQLPVAVHCRRLSGEVTKKASASGGDVTVEPLKNERGEVRETHHPHSQPT